MKKRNFSNFTLCKSLSNQTPIKLVINYSLGTGGDNNRPNSVTNSVCINDMGVFGGTSAASVLRQQGGIAAQALKGKVALVTGGNSGAGFETVKVLALAGARVIIAGRRPEAVQTAVFCIQAELKKSETGGTVEALPTPCDLESLASVRAYAAALLVHMGDATPLHLLVLNAGVMFQPFRRSPQGLEVTWSVNHLYTYIYR